MDAIYARQSVDKKDSISIETQIDLCKRELLPGSKVAIYLDKGYSGSSMNRPEFQRLLEDVKSGKITRIITYRLDRISRSVLDFANLIDLFEKYGVTFNSTQEKFDTSTPMGKAMLNITMVFAQLERETIQQRIRDNYYARGEKGMYLGGPPPYGFTKIECQTEQGKIKQLETNPYTSQTLARLFEMFGDELCSLGQISRSLNDGDIPSPNGTHWDSSKVSRILRNPAAVKADVDVYHYYRRRGCKFTNNLADFALGKGCYLYGKREGHERKYTDVTDHTLSLAPHDGLISSDLFLRCQKRLDDNKQIDNRNRSQITWLTGLIKCGTCGYSTVPKRSNGGQYTYLYCVGKTHHSSCTIAGNLGLLSTVEAVIEERIFHWAERYSDLRATTAVTENGERTRLRIRAEEVNVSIQKLIDLAIDSSDITAKYLNEKMAELENERTRLEESLDALNEHRHEKLGKEIADVATEWDHLALNQKSTIAMLLINRISLFKEEIEIEWKYNFDM